MEVEAVKQLLETQLKHSSIQVFGDEKHFTLTIISPEFAGKNTVKRQQIVYAVLNNYIQAGEIHAVNMQTFTPEEWEQANA